MKKILSAFLLLPLIVRAAQELHPVQFTLNAPGAKSVIVSGAFNSWSTNALPMKRSSDGSWFVNTRLPAGTYGYKFIQDGNWILDPGNSARTVVNQIETSKLTVPQPFPGFTTGDGRGGASAKPAVPWDAAAVQKANEKYQAAAVAFSTYVQKRGDPAQLKKIEAELKECAAVFEKYQDSAPRGSNCSVLLNRCNKLIFDVHATMQVTR